MCCCIVGKIYSATCDGLIETFDGLIETFDGLIETFDLPTTVPLDTPDFWVYRQLPGDGYIWKQNNLP